MSPIRGSENPQSEGGETTADGKHRRKPMEEPKEINWEGPPLTRTASRIHIGVDQPPYAGCDEGKRRARIAGEKKRE